MRFSTIAVVSCFVASVTSIPISNNIGAKIRLTNKAFDYLVMVAKSKVANLKVPPVTTSGKASFISYKITNLTTTSLVIGPSSIRSLPQRQSIHVSVTGVGAKANAHAKFGYFGSKMAVNAVDVTFDIDVKIKDVNGVPVLEAKNCHCDVTTLRMTFESGGVEMLYNMIKVLVISNIKEAASVAICTSVTEAINVKANDEIRQINMSVLFEPSVELDFHLARSPRYDCQYIESYHKGALRVNDTPISSPFAPAPFPAFINKTKMAYGWMSQYVVNQVLYFSYLRRDYTKLFRDADIVHLLKPKFNCHSGIVCLESSLIGVMIPDWMGFLNPSVEVDIAALTQPTVMFTTAGVSLTAETRVKVILWAGSMTNELFDIRVVCKANVTANVSKDVIYVDVIGIAVAIDDLKTSTPMTKYTDMANKALRTYALKYIKQMLVKGFPIPKTQQIEMKNMEIIFENGAVVVGTDVKLNI